MPWTVAFHDEFNKEFALLPAPIRVELTARLLALAEFGPDYGRSNVDTLKGSDFGNMKELRFRLDGLWRFAFAFDPVQRAIVLVGGDKEGANQKRFYKALIRTADRRFSAHVETLSPRERKPRDA